jgi:ABC-type transport system substrate-binding protein
MAERELRKLIASVRTGRLSRRAFVRKMVWKLKTGVEWHDGRPITADDVVFNWQYASDPATAGRRPVFMGLGAIPGSSPGASRNDILLLLALVRA